MQCKFKCFFDIFKHFAHLAHYSSYFYSGILFRQGLIEENCRQTLIKLVTFPQRNFQKYKMLYLMETERKKGFS